MALLLSDISYQNFKASELAALAVLEAAKLMLWQEYQDKQVAMDCLRSIREGPLFCSKSMLAHLKSIAGDETATMLSLPHVCFETSMLLEYQLSLYRMSTVECASGFSTSQADDSLRLKLHFCSALDSHALTCRTLSLLFTAPGRCQA